MSALHHLNQSALSTEVKLSLFGLFWLVSFVFLTTLLLLGPKYMHGPCSLWWEQPARIVCFCASVSGQGEVFLLKELMLITHRDPTSSWEQQQPLASSGTLRGRCQYLLSGPISWLGQAEEGGSSSGEVSKHLYLSSVLVGVGWNW